MLKKKILKGESGMDFPTFDYQSVYNISNYQSPEDEIIYPLTFNERKKFYEKLSPIIPTISNFSSIPKQADLLVHLSKLDEKELEYQFDTGTFGKNYGGWSVGLDTTNSVLSGLFENKGYDGLKGNVRSGIDTGWNSVADNLGKYGGTYGKLASLGMKGVNILNTIQGGIFGSTDSMTTTDAIMDSPIGFLTGIGWANQAFGKKTNTITKNEDAFASLGNDYIGTSSVIDDALKFSGKKYGWLSNGARQDANALLANRTYLQLLAEDISEISTDRLNLKNSMSAINGNRRAFNMNGGYNLKAIYLGRNGLSFKTIETAKKIVSTLKLLKGGKNIDPYQSFLASFPKGSEGLYNTSDYRMQDYWIYNGKPATFDEAVSKGMFTQQSNGWHANSVAENPETGEIEFMKSSSHPSHLMEVDWYNSDKAAEFRSLYELLKTEPYWKYVRRKPSSFKEGGLLKEISLDDILEEYLEPYILKEVSLDLPEFLEGGKFNVIPEGALHARLHHMENADNLTKKGIPVVSEKENGELEQQAEIERNEIILRLSVTQKLEELCKKYDDTSTSNKDEIAIEAGKLLVDEILNNTIDNTGLINQVN